MKTNLIFLTLLTVLCGSAAGRNSALAAGRASYTAGEFKQAVAHLRMALDADPCDAESHYWLGMSYQRLMDIAAPFGGKYHAKAQANLTRAAELAPAREDYRLELFEFLLDPSAWSRDTARLAAGMLRATPQSNPEYSYMRERLESEVKASAGAEDQLGGLIFTITQAGYEAAQLPPGVLKKLRNKPGRGAARPTTGS